MKYYLAALAAVVLLAIPWASFTYPTEWGELVSAARHWPDQLAAVILSHNAKSVAELQARYNGQVAMPQAKVRILIVPGHGPDYGGAEYGSLKERDMVVELANALKSFLETSGRYQIFMTRQADGWDPAFAWYFSEHHDEIVAWQKASREEISQLKAVGSMQTIVPKVRHNRAPDEVAYRLYGITKWANEHDVDIVVHIHINDDSAHSPKTAGDHSGFAIYVPERQYANGSSTKAVAQTVFKRLSTYNPVSDFSGEAGGIIEDSQLIATGAYNTSDAASMLIEYGYIYEQQFQDPAIRSLALKDLAYQTYLSLQDFFEPVTGITLGKTYDTLTLPHAWTVPIMAKNTISPDVFALQSALIEDGEYPPTDASWNECPRSGKLGNCTLQALQAFQDKHGINDEKGQVGPDTIRILNGLFSKGNLSQ